MYHRLVAKLLGKCPAFLQDFDRTRYVAFAKKDAGLAKDTRVTQSFF